MPDSKTSCLIWGIIGILFGVLALILSQVTLNTVYGLFWVLVILGIILFLFLAITGRSEESILWFGLSAVLLVIGFLSIMVQVLIEYLIIMVITAVAVCNGFSDITLALDHSRTKYILIPGMIITALLLLTILLHYYPGIAKYLILTVVGTSRWCSASFPSSWDFMIRRCRQHESTMFPPAGQAAGQIKKTGNLPCVPDFAGGRTGCGVA